MQSSPLFDTRAAWRDNPRQAFEAYIASEDFLRAGKSRTPPKEGQKIRAASAVVYLAQWSKFERWLAMTRTPFTSVGADDIRRFLDEGLDAGRARPASPATRQRYAQLLQRIYARACSLGAVPSNPVAELLARQAYSAPRATMPTNATRATIVQLQRWLLRQLRQALAQDPMAGWREARDCAMASLALGSGLRCRELALLSQPQIRAARHAAPHERFEISIARSQTTATARGHSCVADALCAPVLEAWLDFRFGPLAAQINAAAPAAKSVFPAQLQLLGRGAMLSDSAIYLNFKRLADEALQAGVLQPDTRWILATGAGGLRRARILLDLRAEVDHDLMTVRLGYWEKRAVRRYREELDKAG